LSRFTILPGLCLQPPGLRVEFNYESNSTSFEWRRNEKVTLTVQILVLCLVSPSGFTIVLGLCLKALGLGAEFNSESNSISLKWDHNEKVALIRDVRD
jgi:hypothetical protein